MSEPDRRLTNQGQERRRQLLDAAAALFSERGYQETRIVDICKEAGVAKGLFYWYFESKEEVFRQHWTVPLYDASAVYGYTDRVLEHPMPEFGAHFLDLQRIVVRGD